MLQIAPERTPELTRQHALWRMRGSRSLRAWPYLVHIGLLVALYVSTARLGLSLDAVGGFATAVWPPTGLALVALILGGYRLWPGITLGAFLVNAWAGLRGAFAVPLRVGTDILGVMEFFSRESRPPDDELLQMVASLGSQLGQFLERMQAEEARRAGDERLHLALQAGQMGTWEWNITTGRVLWSETLEAIHGIAPGTFPGTYEGYLSDIHPEDLSRVTNAIAKTLAEGSDHRITYRIVLPDDLIRWVEGRGRLFSDQTGRPVRMSGVCMGITERKLAEEEREASLREKEVLLKEIHHRVKNNLQVICSLLSLQSDVIQEPRLQELFHESQQRIRSMALIHETLYQASDVARFNLAHYLLTLSNELFRSYGVEPHHIALKTEIADAWLPLDCAMPCGLILNELLSNALKHAFADGRCGEIHVALEPRSDRHATLRVRDTGVGFPEGLDFRQTDSLGLQLVCALTEQLQGTITLERNGGTAFTLTFPWPAGQVSGDDMTARL